MSTEEREKYIFARVFYHRLQSKMAGMEAVKLEESMRTCEEAAARCWNPFADESKSSRY
jgi:hypothetical protein